jgi:esterase FrsA
VLIASGGVDTWKMDIHPMCIAAAQSTGATVLAVDMPGTGEIANLPLGAEADQVVLGVAQAAKAVGNGRVGHIAISFGANFSAMTGLTGAVDAAVDNGGPVKDAFSREHITRLPYGMFDIVGNAIGFDRRPDIDDVIAVIAVIGTLSREKLLDQPDGNPPCSWSTARTTTSYPRPTPRSSRGARTPRCTSSPAPGTWRCRRWPRSCR